MIQLITNLLLINLIMVLVHESGFITYMDDWINEKFPFHHLPYPILCCLCGVWWLSLLYIIITGNFTLLNIALCLLNAHLTQFVQALFRFLLNLLYKVVDLLNRLVDN